MSQTVTNYTSYDLAYYYADLTRVARLTDAQRQHLLTRLPGASIQDGTTPIHHQLIESYLPFAKYLAIDLCPRSASHRSLPDLIGAANLTLVETIGRRDLTHIEHLTAYLAACLRGALQSARADENLITIPWSARAREQGTSGQVHPLINVASLDEAMHWYQTDECEEPRVLPLTPTEPAPPRNEQQRAQVETYLSYLSPRAQAILRLRYGLSEDNERRHTTDEIVRLLGIERKSLLTTERDAITRLRAMVAGKATIGKRNGKPCICSAEVTTRPRTLEEETALMNASSVLQAQGHTVSGRSLAKATGIPVALVFAFLRDHRTEPPAVIRERERQRRLEKAYSRLQAQGKPCGYVVLAREAKVGKPAALEFLKTRRGERSHAPIEAR